MSWAAVAVGGATLVSGIIAGMNTPDAQVAKIEGATQEQADKSYGNTEQGLQQQQAFMQALQGQNGIQNQSDVYNMLAMQAAGQGPNPAQMALNNATGQNVANQAALMAGQRGANANAGLIARQAAMQGGAIQQQAAGQGALMQAQQQQAAMNAMGGIAGQQVQNLGGATNAYSQSALAQQQNLLNSISNQNDARVRAAGGVDSVNQANAKAENAATGSMINAAGGMMGTMATKSPTTPTTPKYDYSGADGMGGGIKQLAHGGAVSSGPQSALGKALALQGGGKVPGQAKVAGDSLKNDTVDAKLSPGEIVLPRTVVQKGPKAAAEFVAAIQARSKSKKK